MKMTTNWFLVLFLSALLLIIALAPTYTSITSVAWVVIVSLYFVISGIWLVIKTWHLQTTGAYIGVYIWIGAMVFSFVQGVAEGQVMNGWLAGCVGGALAGGIAGCLIEQIKIRFRGKNVRM